MSHFFLIFYASTSYFTIASYFHPIFLPIHHTLQFVYFYCTIFNLLEAFCNKTNFYPTVPHSTTFYPPFSQVGTSTVPSLFTRFMKSYFNSIPHTLISEATSNKFLTKWTLNWLNLTEIDKRVRLFHFKPNATELQKGTTRFEVSYRITDRMIILAFLETQFNYFYGASVVIFMRTIIIPIVHKPVWICEMSKWMKGCSWTGNGKTKRDIEFSKITSTKWV